MKNNKLAQELKQNCFRGRFFNFFIWANVIMILSGAAAPFVSAAALEEPVFPIRPSEDGHYLVDQKGRPFFYHADTAWTLTKKLDPKEIAEYLDDRRAAGFTVIQIHAVSKEKGPAANRDGFEPFSPPDDIKRPNEAYWRNVDQIISAAGARNLLVAMSALWLRWGGSDREGWRYQLAASNAKTYGEFLGRRYQNCRNLIWILGGDANPIERTRMVGDLARGIRKFAPEQLITVHNSAEYSSRAFFAEEE